jgi:predicted anti-sigma-YlaC factor YlaD
MHRLIKDRLEDQLKGAPETVPPECEQHLKICEECREELNLMQEQSYLLQGLRPAAEAAEPRPGFYARVMERVEAQQRASIWNVFLEPVFGRRLAAASMTLMLLLGGYLAFSEREPAWAPDGPEAIMAVEEHSGDLGVDQERDRDTILVNLATYRE